MRVALEDDVTGETLDMEDTLTVLSEAFASKGDMAGNGDPNFNSIVSEQIRVTFLSRLVFRLWSDPRHVIDHSGDSGHDLEQSRVTIAVRCVSRF